MNSRDAKRKEAARDGKPPQPSTPVPSVGSVGGMSRLSPFGSVGRIKEPPVCKSESLTKESLSFEQLSKMCWSTSPAEQSSSVAPQEALSQSTPSVETDGTKQNHESRNVPLPAPGLFKRMTSRTGRETQRWSTDSGTNQLFRLTTGTVPIMTDGRILFCSSSRKQEWILPKGGWEADETMEESALRETFEEAGVLGVIGPKLQEVEYETRKAKKRRLEREERVKKFQEETERMNIERVAASTMQKGAMPPPQPLPSAVVSVQSHSSCAASSEDEHLSKITAAAVAGDAGNGNSSPAMDVSSKGPRKKIVGASSNASSGASLASTALHGATTRDGSFPLSSANHLNDDTASVASGTSEASASCGHARMSLFPLYVTEVRDEWPESGRARKVMDIDAAIKMMEPRPEFRAVLEQVKEKGLHLTFPTGERDTGEIGGNLNAPTNGTSAPAEDVI